MLKPTFLNILFYILFKYLIVYLVFMIATNNYKIIQVSNVKNGADLFYYLWLLLFLPVVSMVLFSAPYYLLFRIKNKDIFIVAIVTILLVEYLFYVYFNSQKHIDMRGILMVLISSIVFYLMFFKKINSHY